MRLLSLPRALRRQGAQTNVRYWPLVLLIAGLFWLLSTVIIAFPAIAPGQNTLLELSEGDLAPRDIVAPRDSQFVSQIRTDEQRQ